MGSFSPILIAGVSGRGLGSYSGVQWGGVQWNGKLWQFVTSVPPSTNTLNAYLSQGGNNATWDLIDALGGISGIAAAQYWSGKDNQVTFLYTPGAASGVASQLRTFDLDLQAWGNDFGAGGPTYAPKMLWRRSDGTYIGLFQSAVSASGDFYIAILTLPDTWGAALDITTGAQGLPGFDPSVTNFTRVTSILDSTDLLHVIFATSSSDPTWQNRYFYQQVKADGTLGIFQEFPGQAATPQDLASVGGTYNGTMAIVSGVLYWGIVRNGIDAVVGAYQFPAVYAGAPLSNPVWAESGNIDPNIAAFFAPDPNPNYQPPTLFPDLFYSAYTGVLYAVYIRNGYYAPFQSNPGQIQVSQISPISSGQWGSYTFYDPDATPPLFAPGADVAGNAPLMVLRADGVILGFSVDFTDVSTSEPEQRYWVGALPPAGNFIGGSSSGRFRCCPPAKARRLMEAAEMVREALKGSECWPWDHLFPPPDAIPVNLLSDIVVPAPSVNRSVILAYQVPIGLKLYLMGLLQDVEAGLFNPGDCFWTVDQNATGGSVQGAGVNGLVSLPVPLGSISEGLWWPFKRAYEFAPQTLLRSTVQNINLTPGAPNYFVSGFLGYLVPVR